MPLQSRQKTEQPLAPSCSLPFALPAWDTSRESHGSGVPWPQLPWGLQPLLHTGTVPLLLLGLEAEQEDLAPLNQPLPGFFFAFQQEQRCSLHAGTCRLLFSQLSGCSQKDQTAELTN